MLISIMMPVSTNYQNLAPQEMPIKEMPELREKSIIHA